MSVASVYAKALFEAIQARGASEAKVEEQLGDFDRLLRLIDESQQLKSVLYAPVSSADEKGKVLQELGKQLEISELIQNFCVLLANKHRLKELPLIRKAFERIRLEAQGGVLGVIESAEPLGDSELQQLKDSFNKKLKRQVEFRLKEDPDLLAGLRVTVNGVTYDGTLRAQLRLLGHQLATSAASSAAS